MLKKLLREIGDHKFVYFLLFIVLVGATYVRIVNTRNILGFYFDQGRDALVIWDFLHSGKPFLVGPTTGIAGIFRGPWYYWLITPFYALGRGDPVWPANFLALTTVAAISLLYYLGKEIFDHTTGLIAATIASFSYYLIVASRWLSNPTPMLLISMLLVASLLAISRGKKWAWMVVGFLLGMAIQFGSAAEIFYIPAVLIFAFWQRKNLPGVKIITLSVFLFLVSFIPQIIFDYRHGGILSGNIVKFLFSGGTFKLLFWEVFKSRRALYWSVFTSKIWVGNMNYFIPYFLAFIGVIIANFRKLWQKPGFKILTLLALSPLIGMIFFQGNEGNVFDYYFTGYYLIFVLVFSIGLGYLAKDKFGLIFVILFFFLFFKSQIPPVSNYLKNGQSHINLKEELQAVDWIYKDAGSSKFNVDVYVPPVIPYAYNYLFLYRSGIYGIAPSESQTKILYTMYEEDIAKRLDPWLARQDTIGRVDSQIVFGGITVQKRERFKTQ